MTSRAAWLRGVAVMALLVTGCNGGDDLTVPDDLTTPRKLTVTPLNLRTVRVQWDAVSGAQSYRLERRTNLTGDFEPVAANVPQSLPGPVVYLDTDIVPETFYGYRVIAVDRLGNASEASAVSGARTPPLPSIDVVTVPIQDGANLVEDPDGYTVVVAGPDSVRRAMSTRATERIGPLRVGRYAVSLDGVASNCRPEASPIPVAVADTGVVTVSQVTFRVTCRDATRGEIVVGADIAGEPPAGAQYRVEVTGVATDQSLPANQRAFSQTIRLGGAGTAARLRDLRPGDYQVELDSLPASCAAEGVRRRDVDVTALSLDTVRYAIRCGGTGGGGGGNRPYVYRNLWQPQAAASGATVELRLGLDLAQTPGAAVGALEASLRYDQQVLRFERIESLDPRFNVVGNGTTAGTVAWGAFTTTAGIVGNIPIAKMVFTVTGAVGTRAITRTSDVRATFFDFTPIDTLVRVAEDTLSVGTGQGGNTPPIAEANGPYSASVGAAVVFLSAGSADPDGTISSYAWDFGDGTNGTGPNPSKSYPAAGTYTARLTVTDNLGASASDQATVTVSSASSTPPSWKATFGTVDAASGTVPLTITYDLTGDVAATAGPEALDTWVVDSLKWDPTVLRFFGFSFGPGGSGTLNSSAAFNGKLSVNGRQAASTSSGVITIAVVRFRVVGSGGRSTTTLTGLGPLTGTGATGGFAYRPLTQITEATFTIPGGGNPTGTVTGTVSRAGGGTISGATVTLNPGGSVTTNANGQYSVAGVAVGSGTVSVTNLPNGCTAPAAKPYTVASGGQTVTVDFTVTCSSSSPTGTVSGTVTRSTGGGIAGATVTLTPGGSATTNASGQYSRGSVPVGSGTVSVSNLPSGCTAPAAKPYTIASGGQTVTVDFSVTCAAAGNAITGKWTVSGTTATLELRANMVSGNLGSIQGSFDAGSARLQYTGFSAAAAPALPSTFATNPPATKIDFGGFTTSAAGLAGDAGIIKLSYTILPGAAATVTGTLSAIQAVNAGFADITPTFAGRITVDPLNLP
ncbi:MAG: PKD domain-containing protein [Gemmatimonadales bacterium]